MEVAESGCAARWAERRRGAAGGGEEGRIGYLKEGERRGVEGGQ